MTEDELKDMAEFAPESLLQQIRDVEEEIDWMQREIEASTCGPADEDDCGCVAIPKRILVARTAALADLKRGLRVAEERTER